MIARPGKTIRCGAWRNNGMCSGHGTGKGHQFPSAAIRLAPFMRCPECQAAETKVIDSRPTDDGAAVRRRRACETCGARFTTYERCEQTLMVRKRSGTIEPFDSAKLTAGVGAALADRPASATEVSALVSAVERAMRARGATVESEDIGKAVLERLRTVDEVAYLRFASVYKEFQGPEDFEREMAELESVTE